MVSLLEMPESSASEGESSGSPPVKGVTQLLEYQPKLGQNNLKSSTQITARSSADNAATAQLALWPMYIPLKHQKRFCFLKIIFITNFNGDIESRF